MLALRDIMTRDLVTAEPGMTLRDAMTLLSENHIGGAPVTQGGKVVGVFSASDILPYVAEMETEQAELTFRDKGTSLEAAYVADVMIRDVKSLPPSCAVRTAAMYMVGANIHRVLVMEYGHLLGMVTTTDIAAAVAEHGLLPGR